MRGSPPHPICRSLLRHPSWAAVLPDRTIANQACLAFEILPASSSRTSTWSRIAAASTSLAIGSICREVRTRRFLLRWPPGARRGGSTYNWAPGWQINLIDAFTRGDVWRRDASIDFDCHDDAIANRLHGHREALMCRLGVPVGPARTVEQSSPAQIDPSSRPQGTTLANGVRPIN